MRSARIAGTGMYVPPRVVTNAELSTLLGEDVDEFLRDTLGIRERHICGPEEATSDLSLAAAERALAAAKVKPEDLDLIIVATDTPEYISPATAAVVQGRLGARNALNYDLNSACAGFVTAVDVAAKYLQADESFKNAAVIGAYAMSKYVNWKDKYTCTLFADGAGAVVLQPSERKTYLGVKFLADGTYHDYIGVYGGGTRFPPSVENLEKGEHLLQFKKKFPRDTNFRGWPPLVEGLLSSIGHKVEEIALILFTQINLSVIQEVMATLGLPMERTHTIMEKWGYTGSGCIPMALDDAVRAGKLKPGDLLVLCASGGGYSMVAAAFYWT